MSDPWASMYAEVWDDLVRYLDRKVWDPERARDLAQETFVRALRADPIPERPRAWLFTVAGNLARDDARASFRRRRDRDLLRIEESDRLEASDPSAELESGERRLAVRRALAELTDRDREVLLLWQSGLSYQEIAAAAGLSEGSVGTTLARARRRLARAWTEAEGRE